METENLPQQTCVNCGHLFSGKYCNQCGEKVLDENDRKISHFFEEFIHMLTHADHKFFKTLRYLFTRPGFLTEEYLTGRRKRYTLPLSLFFIGNLIYFLLPRTDSFNTHYFDQINKQVYSKYIYETAMHKMQEKHWNVTQMAEHYDHTSGKVSKLLLILLIFMFSVPVTILNHSREKYYFNHLAFATEFINFIIYSYLIAAILFGFITYGLHYYIDPYLNSEGFIISVAVLFCLFLYMASKRVYNQSWLLSLIKAMLLTFSMMYVIMAYRFILFYATILFL